MTEHPEARLLRAATGPLKFTTMVDAHDCNGAASSPPSQTDRLCSVCGTQEAHDRHSSMLIRVSTVILLARVVGAARVRHKHCRRNGTFDPLHVGSGALRDIKECQALAALDASQEGAE